MEVRWVGTAVRVVVATALIALTVGCSYVYDVAFRVGIPVGTAVPVIVEVLDPFGMTERTVVVPTAGQTAVSATVSVCCAPEPVVSMQAYLDLNNNGSHDAGEPLQLWPGNPVQLTGNTAVQLQLAAGNLATPAAVTPSANTP